MASLLSDVLKKAQGRDPIEEDKTAANATRAQQQQGLGNQPDEAGIEPDYTLEELGAAAASGGGGLLGGAGRVGMAAARKAGNGALVSALKDQGAPQAEQQLSKAAWNKALANPDALDVAVTDPGAANAAAQFEQSAIQKSAQKIKDVASGAVKPGGQISEGPGLDYGAMNQAEMEAARSNTNPELNYNYFKESTPEGSNETLQYPVGKPTQSVKDLQDQMSDAYSSGDYKTAKTLQDQIRQLRESPSWMNSSNSTGGQ